MDDHSGGGPLAPSVDVAAFTDGGMADGESGGCGGGDRSGDGSSDGGVATAVAPLHSPSPPFSAAAAAAAADALWAPPPWPQSQTAMATADWEVWWGDVTAAAEDPPGLWAGWFPDEGGGADAPLPSPVAATPLSMAAGPPATALPPPPPPPTAVATLGAASRLDKGPRTASPRHFGGAMADLAATLPPGTIDRAVGRTAAVVIGRAKAAAAAAAALALPPPLMLPSPLLPPPSWTPPPPTGDVPSTSDAVDVAACFDALIGVGAGVTPLPPPLPLASGGANSHVGSPVSLVTTDGSASDTSSVVAYRAAAAAATAVTVCCPNDSGDGRGAGGEDVAAATAADASLTAAARTVALCRFRAKKALRRARRGAPAVALTADRVHIAKTRPRVRGRFVRLPV
ncbi:hypothetical protein BU14_0204s0032 [Porphyra umbilicalis]|uniref:CCT domain-containing protein n=1 Tax=Porphyra umbilicalis TaxID=2786 RepID=A0A1X6P607_PORUM|nr:hypothetical protein BU14_0204s0032 [Porphyra umbilicalis]|eukprot:OSX76186.1 hypothetical protein BU14_0204s0032 [Porphyra umbilicalis]